MPRLKDFSCFLLGSIFSLGSLIPATLFVGPFGLPGEQRYTINAPQTATTFGLVGPATDASTTTAECSAVLRKCAARQVKPSKEQGSNNKIPSDDGSYKVGKNAALLVRAAFLPHIRKRGPADRNEEEHKDPSSSTQPRYPNKAIEHEMHKHDRWVVDSISFLQAFGGGENEAYYSGGLAGATEISGRQSSASKPITLVILTVNRLVPYLAVLMASLIRGHDPSTLGKYVDLHVINIERRPCRCSYQLLSDLEEKLPFVTFHDWTAPYPQHSTITDSHRMYILNQRLDYIRALELCMEKNSKWCLVMEDDAIATSNLVPKFMKIAADENVTDLGVLALYFPYNDSFSKANKLRSNTYALQRYDEDAKALRWMDPGTLSGLSPRLRYRTEKFNRTYGAVANAYPASVLERMAKYLRPEDATTSQAAYATDTMLMRNFFLKEKRLKKIAVNPSLVNHIGHYSEHRPESEMIPYMSTDVRFQLEDDQSNQDDGPIF